VETGVQGIHNYLKKLDSGFRRNDGKPHFHTFYESINIYISVFSVPFVVKQFPKKSLRLEIRALE
jgi:hypothetical protein